MTTAEKQQKQQILDSERQTLEEVRAKNKLADVRASRSASEIHRASKRSEKVVDVYQRRLRSAGVDID
jgi:hypothetical protein